MSFTPGTRVGPFEIAGLIGVGGMGEVYRARDSRLAREIAIKVLPEEFLEGRERKQRFEREARLLAALNHRGIAAIYSFEEIGERHLLVMELVEGPTLRELLAGGALPSRKLLGLAVQIAEGLAAAHASGIVHRDLKPENVIVKPDGQVKILDFGLAKLVEPAPESDTGLKTVDAATGTGVVMGTAGYMSPEQAAAGPVDFRSDQFAFGAVLYEMTTGRRAFSRRTSVETLAAIIREEPEPVASLNAATPAPLRWIIERCLAKDPEERYAATEDLARELRALRDHHSELVSSPGSPARRVLRLGSLAAALVALAAGVFAGVVAGRGFLAAPPRQPRFRQVTFNQPGVLGGGFAPDGQSVVYTALMNRPDAGGGPALESYMARIGNPEPLALGLRGMTIESVSRSGEMALIDRGKARLFGTLSRAPLGGGAPREIAEDVAVARWSPDGGSLAVVRRAQGKTRLEYPMGNVLLEDGRLDPAVRVSPDGRLLAYWGFPFVRIVDSEGYARELPTLEANAMWAWSPDGREIWGFHNDGDRTDVRAASPGGRVGAKGAWWMPGGGTERGGLTALLRSRGRRRTIVSWPGGYSLCDIAPDGRLLVLRWAFTGLTFARFPGEAQERDLTAYDRSEPVDLSEDGRTLLFTALGAAGGPQGGVYVRGTDGSAPKRLADGNAMALSPDGKFVLAKILGTEPRLFLVPTGPGEVRPLGREGFEGLHIGGFLPDGKTIWFNGREKGRPVRTFLQSVEGGAPRPLTEEGTRVRAVNPAAPQALVATGNGRFQILELDGGTTRAAPGFQDGDDPIRWSHDGRAIFVRRGAILPDLFRVDLATGGRTALPYLGLPATRKVDNVRAVTNGDGRVWVYGYRLWQSDLVVVEGLR